MTKKAITTKTNKPKKKPTKAPLKGKDTHNKMGNWLIVTMMKVAFIFIIVIGFYSLYLDGKVRNTFEGQRWEIPAQVYASISTVNIAEKVDLTKLVNELSLLSYQRVKKISAPGQYSLSGSRLAVFRRQFDFGFGLEMPTKIVIEARNGDVVKLTQDGEQTYQVFLEPVLIDRILSSEGEDRVFISLEQMPALLIDTLLLIEDRDFYQHYGISPTGILRAFWKNLLAGSRVQGGSTLTQQLAKNMYLNSDKTLWRKANEAIISIILELRYSKDQILEAYFNEVYLGQHYANGIYGFGLGSQFYFGKPLNELSPNEIALLVAQVKGPSYYDPWRKPERAQERRDLVLRLMYESESINQVEYQSGLEEDLHIRPERRFFKQSFPAYMQLVRKELKRIGAANALQSGIRVFTGFDINKQLNAEQALVSQLAQLEKSKQSDQLQGAMIVSDIRTGTIEAVVGDKATKFSGFNRALNAKRPIGSLIKPVVYLAALERYEQYSLATPIADEPISLKSSKGKMWQPKNYDGKFRGSVPLHDGLVKSYNVPTVNLGLKLGLDNVEGMLNALGYPKDVNLVPSMLLGAINMSPFEVNQWFNTIANGGTYNEPWAIKQVLSGQGEVLWQKQPQYDPRLSDQGGYLIDYALQKVTKEGTAKSLAWKFPSINLAGKTGTSNDLRDSWFVGYDQLSLVTTWVGRDDNKSSGLTGSSGALTVFAKYIEKQGGESREVSAPDGVEMTTFELETGNAITEDCLNVVDYPAMTRGLFYSKECKFERPEPPSWLEKLFGVDD